MTICVGINGFDEIGKMIYRKIETRRREGEDICITVINDPYLTSNYVMQYISHESSELLFKNNEENLDINSSSVKILNEKNPEDIPWNKMNVDVVIELTEIFPSLKKGIKDEIKLFFSNIYLIKVLDDEDQSKFLNRIIDQVKYINK